MRAVDIFMFVKIHKIRINCKVEKSFLYYFIQYNFISGLILVIMVKIGKNIMSGSLVGETPSKMVSEG
jgi:hypothetical protein